MKSRRAVFSFDLEITACCNNDCRYCYINLPAGGQAAQACELSMVEIIKGVPGEWHLFAVGE